MRIGECGFPRDDFVERRRRFLVGLPPAEGQPELVVGQRRRALECHRGARRRLCLPGLIGCGIGGIRRGGAAFRGRPVESQCRKADETPRIVGRARRQLLELAARVRKVVQLHEAQPREIDRPRVIGTLRRRNHLLVRARLERLLNIHGRRLERERARCERRNHQQDRPPSRGRCKVPPQQGHGARRPQEMGRHRGRTCASERQTPARRAPAGTGCGRQPGWHHPAWDRPRSPPGADRWQRPREVAPAPPTDRRPSPRRPGRPPSKDTPRALRFSRSCG